MTTALVDYQKTIALMLARSSIIFDNQQDLGHCLMTCISDRVIWAINCYFKEPLVFVGDYNKHFLS